MTSCFFSQAATRTPWWLVPCVWLPLAAYTLCLGVHTGFTPGMDEEFGVNVWL